MTSERRVEALGGAQMRSGGEEGVAIDGLQARIKLSDDRVMGGPMLVEGLPKPLAGGRLIDNIYLDDPQLFHKALTKFLRTRIPAHTLRRRQLRA